MEGVVEPVEALDVFWSSGIEIPWWEGAIGCGPVVYGGVGEVTTGNRPGNLSILAAVSKGTTAGSVATGEAIQAIKLVPFCSVPNRQQLPFVSCWIRFNSSPDAGGLDKTAGSNPSSERVKGLPGARAWQRRAKAGFRGEEDSDRGFQRESVSVWTRERKKDKLAMAPGERKNPESQTDSRLQIKFLAPCARSWQL